MKSQRENKGGRNVQTLWIRKNMRSPKFPCPAPELKRKKWFFLSAVAIATLLAPVSFCPKTKYLHLHPLK